MPQTLLLLILSTLIFSDAHAQVRYEEIQYETKNESFGGLLVTQSDKPGATKQPTVIMLHDRMGMSPFIKRKAAEIASMGYTVFVADLYGKNKQPKNTEQAIAISRSLKAGTRADMRALNLAAYLKAKDLAPVDPSRISVIGYCFGGTAALEMGRQGLKLDSIISVHGNLNTAKPEDARNIKSKMLVLHGAVDPIVPASEVEHFFSEMNAAKVDYQFVAYSNAVHAFTKKEAGDDPSKGAAYNKTADKRATEAVRSFLREVYH